MKARILAMLLMMALLFALLPGAPVLADCNNEAVVIYHAPWLHLPWYQQYGNYEPLVKVITNYCEIIDPRVSIFQVTIGVYLKKYQYDASASVVISLYRLAPLTDGHYCNVDLVLQTTISTTSWATGEWRWVTMHDPDAVMWDDDLYGIEINCTDGKNVVWGYNEDGGAFPENQGRLYYSGGDCQGVSATPTTNYMGVKIQGCWAPALTVLTQDGYVNSAGYIVMGGLVTSLGVSGTVRAYIDYGMTEDLGNTQFVQNIKGLELDKAYYNWRLSVGGFPPNTYCYFRARIEDDFGGAGYGEIDTVFIPEIIPQISCRVVANEAWNCTFQTIINSIDNVEAANLVLYYGQNWSCFGTADNVTMHENVTAAGVYNWEDINYGIFDAGESYYFYAEETTTEGVTIVRSDVGQFKRYDINKPGWQNSAGDWVARIFGWVGLPPISGWWILIFGMFLLIFIIGTRAKNWRAGLIWGLIVMCIMMYIMVSNGMVNGWLVVLLSIVAGYALYELVIKKAVRH